MPRHIWQAYLRALLACMSIAIQCNGKSLIGSSKHNMLRDRGLHHISDTLSETFVMTLDSWQAALFLKDSQPNKYISFLTSSLMALVPVSGSSQPFARQANLAAPSVERSSRKISTDAAFSAPRCAGTAPTLTPVKHTACGKRTCITRSKHRLHKMRF